MDSFNAQVLSLYSQAEHPDLWADIGAGLFAALCQDGHDIAEADVLTDIAVTAGLDASALPAALGDEQLRDRLPERFTTTRRNSVTDVPTFITESRVVTEYPAEGLQSCSTPCNPTRQRERQFLGPCYEYPGSGARHATTIPQIARPPARRNAVSNPARSTTTPPTIGARNAPANPTLVWNATAVEATRESTTSRTYVNDRLSVN
jgi:hypothetical protein